MKTSAHNSFLERLARNSPEDTLAMRDSIETMLESPGWAFVQDLLEQRVEAIRHFMATGIHEQAEYAGMVAEMRGLQSVKAAAEAVMEAANRAELALSELAVGLAAGD